MTNEMQKEVEIISEGLYVHRYNILVNGVEKTLGNLYSARDYYFYDNEAEVYDDEGNLLATEDILPNQRLYMQYRSLSLISAKLTNAELAKRFIVVHKKDMEVLDEQ